MGAYFNHIRTLLQGETVSEAVQPLFHHNSKLNVSDLQPFWQQLGIDSSLEQLKHSFFFAANADSMQSNFLSCAVASDGLVKFIFFIVTLTDS